MSVLQQLQDEAILLLKELISSPSFSGEEDTTAQLIAAFLSRKGVEVKREHNNIWACNKYYDSQKPSILLNSHHDTVRPNKGYTRDPFLPSVEGEVLYGLGSNDAGGCLVALLATFVYYYECKGLQYNLIIAATGEEENSGPHCLQSLLPSLPEFDFAIVGEPTQMQLAIAEKGLMVLIGEAPGKAGHAAREEGENAIYNAMKDISWIQQYQFDRQSETLGKVKMSVTKIASGTQHNVVPASCEFLMDVRTNDAYTNQEVLDIIQAHTISEIKVKSMRFEPSFIPKTHPVVQAGIALGRTTYGSPTLSDQWSIQQPSLKLGPGDSARSHTADEYILLSEIREGIALYIAILDQLVK